MFREKCLVCGSKELNEIVNLGSHPFADSFIPHEKLSESDGVYPLICDLCAECGHVQSRCKTDPKARYAEMDYSYTSSNSSFTRAHWDEYAKEISEEIELENGFVVEVGSNDGYLASKFKEGGNNVIGVDPSPRMANLAKEIGVDTMVELFNNEVAEQIVAQYGKADLVTANNVFNHADNPVEFVRAVEKVLTDKGSFVFEQPYWLDLIQSGKFDQIYHEHVNYFTIRSISELLSKAGMAIKKVKIVNFHGKSIRVTAVKKEKLTYDESELFKLETYERFMKKNILKRSKFLQKIHRIKEAGEHIVAVAAAAKGNTFLNYYKLDNTMIDYVTDASPQKKGKYTPGTRIPIVGDEIFAKYDKVYALILTGNLPEKIKEILLGINPKIEFLFPDEDSFGI
jgi:SAM-dependent methyltransferase